MDLSVIIPAYNARAYLAQCLQSAFAACQRAAITFEIIVVDDGSTDNTAALAAQLGARLIRQPQRGAAVARNAGLLVARGRFVMFLDADDILLDQAVASLLAPLLADAALLASFALAQEFISPELPPEQQRRFAVRPLPYAGCLPGCVMVRRPVFDKVGRFDETLPAGETVAWLLALKDTGGPFADLDITTLHRRLHPASTGMTQRALEQKSYLALLRNRMKNRL